MRWLPEWGLRPDAWASARHSFGMISSHDLRSLETTEIYTYADTEAKRAAIQRAMGSKTAETIVPKYTVSDEDLLRRLYGL